MERWGRVAQSGDGVSEPGESSTVGELGRQGSGQSAGEGESLRGVVKEPGVMCGEPVKATASGKHEVESPAAWRMLCLGLDG